MKCRIGIDDQDPEISLDALARGVIAAGADALIVHARKAWLNGLSPKENRDIPPLDYDRVYRLKAAMPDVPIIINGGIASIAEAKAHLAHVDGVMLGRAAYQEPWRLLDGRSRTVRRGGAACDDEGRVRGDDALYRDANSRRARGCTRSRGISSAHFTGCRARARSAAISPRTASRPDAGVNVLRDAIALVEERARWPRWRPEALRWRYSG